MREPDPVLRTVTLAAVEPRFLTVNEGQGRLYTANNDAAHPLSILDTRTADPVQPLGSIGQATDAAVVDDRTGRSFDTGRQHGELLMFDTRSGALLKAIPIPWQGGSLTDALDAQRERDFLAFAGAPVLLAIDTRTGGVLRTMPACVSYDPPALSYATRRVFEFCSVGATPTASGHGSSVG